MAIRYLACDRFEGYEIALPSLQIQSTDKRTGSTHEKPTYSLQSSPAAIANATLTRKLNKQNHCNFIHAS